MFDRLHEQLDRFLVRGEIRRETAFVADARRQAARAQHVVQRVEDLRAPPQPFIEGSGSDRNDHELLHVHRVIRVRAAVHDVEARDRHHVRVRAAEVSEQRQADALGRGLGSRERNGEHRVRAQAPLVVCSIQVEKHPVDAALIRRVGAEQGWSDGFVHIGDRTQDALPRVPLVIVVP